MSRADRADHASAASACGLHRVHAHTAACTYDQHALAGADPRPQRAGLDHGGYRVRDEAGLLERNRVGQLHQIARGHGDELGIASISMCTDHAAAMVVEPGTERLAAHAAIL